MRAALLRAQLETALGERASSPFTDVEKRTWECVSSGIPALDKAIGGLPRGAIVEILGAPSSGRTSLALNMLAAMVQRGEVCALVDGTDAFDPESGAAAGIDMRRLLWVRCRNLDPVLRSTDLLLQGGGFGAIAVDLSDLPQKAVREVPLAVWFRFQRVLQNTPTVLLMIGRESVAKSAAAVVLRASLRKAAWKHPAGDCPSWTGGVAARSSKDRAASLFRADGVVDPEKGFLIHHPGAASLDAPPLLSRRGNRLAPSHSLLLTQTHLDIEILRIQHSQCRTPKVRHDVRLHAYS